MEVIVRRTQTEGLLISDANQSVPNFSAGSAEGFELMKFLKKTGMSKAELVEILGVDDLSARYPSLKKVFSKGLEIWGKKEFPNFVHWLQTPLPPLGMKKPMELATTPEGIEEVLKILGRIEHGVHS